MWFGCLAGTYQPHILIRGKIALRISNIADHLLFDLARSWYSFVNLRLFLFAGLSLKEKRKKERKTGQKKGQ